MLRLRKRKRRFIKPESIEFDNNREIDPVKGVVKDVKIVGLRSQHGYDYTPSALKTAIPLYEGIRVNIDHPERDKPNTARSYRDRFGKLSNVHFVEGDGLRGDFHYNPKHEISNQFAWDVENNPKACGFSHNARGPLRQRGDRMRCESIDTVRSVDLVADAATTRSLFEGLPAMKVKKRKPAAERMTRREVRRNLVESYGRRTAATLLESLDPAAAQALASGGESSGNGGGGDNSNVEALLALVRQVLADPNITAEESIKAVTKRLKALKEMIPGGSSKDAGQAGAGVAAGTMPEGLGDDDEDEEEDTDEEEAAPKGKGKNRLEAIDPRLTKLLTRLEAKERKADVRELCEGEGFKPTDKQMALLLKHDEEEDQLELIESWTGGSTAPRRKVGKAKSRDMLESEGEREYKSSKEWVKGLKA